MNNNVDKLDSAIDSIVEQIEYLTGQTLNKVEFQKNLKKQQYDPAKDQIRSSSDLVWQLSTSLTNLLGAKNAIMYMDKLEQQQKNVFTAILGESKDE